MQPSASLSATPLSQNERILVLDSLRGIALLGILMMNIPLFGLPSNPAVMGELGTINFKVWYFVDWFLEGSQRALFSMLFGCGIFVFISRLEKRLDGSMPAELFMRRQLWLLLFGLVNAWIFLWEGDILYHYATLGIIVFPFRRLRPVYLIVAAIVCLVLMTARENRDLYLQKDMIEKGEAVAAIDTTQVKLTDKQKDQLGAMNGFKDKQKLENQKKEAKKRIEEITGTYGETYDAKSNINVWIETHVVYYYLWDILLFMFLGLAFFKLGLIQGEHSIKTYIAIAVIGFGIGLPVSYFRLEPLIQYQFNMFDYQKNVSFEFYEISRTFRSLGLFGLIMVLYKSGWFKWLFSLMQPVGQMAFTNYLMQSVICGIIFYGVGFGLFGKLQRFELYYVVGSIWIFQIIFSNIWMVYFRFGPMEWLWRSLTYWKKQSIRKDVPEVATAQA